MTCICLEEDSRFKDLPEGPDDFQRLANIGRDDLLMWWDKTRSVIHPSTYGQTDHDFTSSVAFYLYTLDRSSIAWKLYDLDDLMKFIIEQAWLDHCHSFRGYSTFDRRIRAALAVL